MKDGKQVAVYPNRFPLWKSDFKLHTFEEEIEFIQGLEKSTGKKIGIYPEIKSTLVPSSKWKDIAKATLEVLKNMVILKNQIWFTYKHLITMN